MTSLDSWLSFNPLDRVKFVQINMGTQTLADVLAEKFQSPRSGQICSNLPVAPDSANPATFKFQSPRSGQICSNQILRRWQ